MSTDRSTGETVALDVADGIANIRLTDPDRLNCFSLELTEGLCAAIARIDDRDDVSVVTITAEGRAFSTGADIDLLEDDQGDGLERSMELMDTAFTWLRNTTIPVIAGAQGATVGAGANLFCYASDLRVGAEDLEIWWPEIEYGETPLPRAVDLANEVGSTRAIEAMLLSRDGSIDAEEAESIGLLTRVVPADDVTTETRNIATTIAGFDREPGLVSEFLDAIYHARREASGGSELHASWRAGAIQREMERLE